MMIQPPPTHPNPILGAVMQALSGGQYVTQPQRPHPIAPPVQRPAVQSPSALETLIALLSAHQGQHPIAAGFPQHQAQHPLDPGFAHQAPNFRVY